MMEVLYVNAMVSDAAYVALDELDIDPVTGTINNSAKELFTNPSDGSPKGRNWTEKQFEWFQRNFKVYQNESGELAYQDNTSSGFAATMFDAENCSCISSTPYVRVGRI